ncbi:MAG: hypothetical protein HW406_2675 [Candidatus Brocadiaceae bacterium]|nr:hypothetical protein [Candidatus Brocadiaceae bacterium]
MVGNFRELRTRFFDLLVLTALSAMVIFPALGQNRQWVSREDPSLVSQTLFNARAGSYLVINEKDYTSLLKCTEAIPGELILSHKVGHHEKMMLFRLGKRTSETPRDGFSIRFKNV